MRKLSKAASVVLAIVMLLTAGITGCGSSTSGTADTTAVASGSSSAAVESTAAQGAVDTSQEVTLKTWLLGDRPADADLVFGEMNKVLKSKVNATMDINYIPWSDANTKYSLLFATGEDFDIAYTATWTSPNFKSLASKNAFMELTTDMLKKYAPKSYEQMPEIAWKQVMVNGKIYTIPSSNDEYGMLLLLIRGDLREKYNLPEVNSLETLKQYLFTIAEKEKGIIPFDVGENGANFMDVLYSKPNGNYVITPSYMQVNVTDSAQKLTYMLDDPKFLDFANLMKEFKDKGVIPSNAASKKSILAESFVAGKSAAMCWNLVNSGVAMRQVLAEHPEWKPEMVDISSDASTYVQRYSNNGNAIKAGSKNWERALMVLELLRTDKDLWDLSNYGIKGTHWEPVGDDKFKSLDGSKNFPPNSNCQWGWNTPLIRYPADLPDVYFKTNDNWIAHKTKNFLLNGFQVDTVNVKSQTANLENLEKQYIWPLQLGAYSDPAKMIAEYKEKAKAGGLDAYLTELTKQATEYVASMK